MKLAQDTSIPQLRLKLNRALPLPPQTLKYQTPMPSIVPQVEQPTLRPSTAMQYQTPFPLVEPQVEQAPFRPSTAMQYQTPMPSVTPQATQTEHAPPISQYQRPLPFATPQAAHAPLTTQYQTPMPEASRIQPAPTISRYQVGPRVEETPQVQQTFPRPPVARQYQTPFPLIAARPEQTPPTPVKYQTPFPSVEQTPFMSRYQTPMPSTVTQPERAAPPVRTFERQQMYTETPQIVSGFEHIPPQQMQREPLVKPIPKPTQPLELLISEPQTPARTVSFARPTLPLAAGIAEAAEISEKPTLEQFRVPKERPKATPLPMNFHKDIRCQHSPKLNLNLSPKLNPKSRLNFHPKYAEKTEEVKPEFPRYTGLISPPKYTENAKVKAELPRYTGLIAPPKRAETHTALEIPPPPPIRYQPIQQAQMIPTEVPLINLPISLMLCPAACDSANPATNLENLRNATYGDNVTVKLSKPQYETLVSTIKHILKET